MTTFRLPPLTPLRTIWILMILMLTGVVYAQPPFGTVIKNHGTVTFKDKSGTPFTKPSNEVHTPVNPSIIKELDADVDTLVAGDRLVYRIILDNRGGDAVTIALRDTIDSILAISGVIGNASVQVSGQVVLANWTPYDADRTDTIRVVTYLRNRIPMPTMVRNQAWMTVSGVSMGTDIIEVPIKDIGRTYDGALNQPDYVVPGEGLLVTVTDKDLNTNPNVAETVVVTVTNARTGEKETLTLQATGPNSDVFTGILPTHLNFTGSGPDNDGVMQVQPADRLTGLYPDVRSQDGPPIDRTDVTIVLPTQIILTPNPRTIIGNGADQSILTARVTDSLGRPLPDGTPVTFRTDKGKFPNGQQEIIIPIVGGNGEAEVVFTSPVLDKNDKANVLASFGGTDSDIVDLEVLPGAIGIRVYDQVRGVDVTSLDPRLSVELTVYGTTVTGQPFGPVNIGVDTKGLFSSELIPPGNYFYSTRILDIHIGEVVLQSEPEGFIVNFDGSVTPPKNSVAGIIRPVGHEHGDQFVGLTVELLDATGVVIGSDIADDKGRYSFEDLDPGVYSLRVLFADGTSTTVQIDRRSRLVGQIIVNVDVLIDPFGQTFDGVTRVVIPNVTVAIRTLDGAPLPLPLLPGTGAVPNENNINPFITISSARYAFLFGGSQVGAFGSPVTYQLTATPPSGSPYLPREFLIEVQPLVPGPVSSSTPVQLVVRSNDGLELAEPNTFKLTPEEVVIDDIAVIALNIPLFQFAPKLELTKSTVEDSIETNTPFEYTLVVTNTGNEVALAVTVADTLNPAIWQLIDAPGASRPAPHIAIWSIGDLQPGERDTVRIQVQVRSPQVNGVQVINRANARMTRGFPVRAESGVFIKSPIRATDINLEPDPRTIVGNGTDFSFVTARVIDNNRDPLPDGTPVLFTTDKGTFENGLQTITRLISGGDGEAVAIFIAPILTNDDTAKVHASFDNVASNTVNLEVLPGAVAIRVFDQVRGVEVRGNDPSYHVVVSLVGRSAIGEPISHTIELDNRGIFAVPEIPAGTYQLKADISETSTGRIISDGTIQSIKVNFDGSVNLPRNAISGTVRGRSELTGSRYAGLTIQLLSETGSLLRTEVIDSFGNYDFQDLVPGNYSVRFSLPDGETYTLPVSPRSRLSGMIVINVTVLIDPFGKTYDAVTRALIPNVPVTLETTTGQVLTLPSLPGTGAVPNTNNTNPFTTDANARFAFLFDATQVGAFGNPVTYILKASPTDGVYLPRTLILTVQPANPGPLTSDSPITVTIKSGDALEIAQVNSFTLTRNPQTADNIAVVAINIPLFKTAPFLQMTKTADPDTLIPTEQTRFTIVVKNTGNEAAIGVTVVDTLTNDWRLIAGSPGGQIVTPHIVRWAVGDMAPGQVDTLWLRVELIPPQLGGTVLTNTAHATTPRGISAEASAPVFVEASPTWEITVRPLVDIVGPGDEIPWVVRFKNIGNEIARNFTLNDSVPLTHTPVWIVNGEGDTTLTPGTLRPAVDASLFASGGTIIGQQMNWPLPDFAVGEEDSAMFITRSSEALIPGTLIVDYASVRGPNNAVWAASSAVVPGRGLKLQITKEATQDTVNNGETVDFRIIVRNIDKVPTAGAITLLDSLPPSLQLVAASKPVGSGNLLNWQVATLAPGQADTVIVSVKVLTDDAFALNKATLRYFTDELSDDAVVNVKPAPTLSLTKSVDRNQAEPGQDLHYLITLTAVGDTINSVTVADTLPGVLAYVRNSSQPPAVYDSLGHILTWILPSVVPGALTELTFTLTPFGGLAPGEHPTRNVAVAHLPDTTAVSNPAEAVIEVPFFVITKRADQSVAEAGDFVVYRLTLENLSSNDSLSGVRVWDRLPHSFKYVDGSTRVDGQPLEPETVIGRDVIWRIPVLAPGQLIQVTYRVVVGSDALSGDGTNTVNATATTPSGSTASAGPARFTVRIRPDAFTQSQMIIGRAWIDENGNGLQDDSEPPVPGVALLMEDGTRIVADRDGKFSIPEVRAGAHVLRLLPRNVPAGLIPVELGVRSARDPWIRFVDVVDAGLTKANFPFHRLAAPPISSLYKTASVVAPPARFWIERLISLEERGPGTEQSSLSLDLLNRLVGENAETSTLSTDVRREAATTSLKALDHVSSGSDGDLTATRALDSRFRIVYRIYSLGVQDANQLTILQNVPQGYIWAPPYQQNSGSITLGDSLILRLTAGVTDPPILVAPRVDLQKVRYLRADSTVATRSIQLTLQSLGRTLSDLTLRDVWFVELELPSAPSVQAVMDTTSQKAPKSIPTVYTGGELEYTFDVRTNASGELVDKLPQGMKPIAVDRLGSVSGDSIRWTLPEGTNGKDYKLWARVIANTDTTISVMNKATLLEQDKASNHMVPGPRDSTTVVIKPLPKWEVSSFTTPESVTVEVSNTSLENLGADSFISGSAVLVDVVQAQLFKVRDRLLSAPTQNILITGHTDSNPIKTAQYPDNFALSRGRATAVRNWLIAAGIDSSRIYTRGYGPTMPVASNKTSDGRRQNRRVELKLIETAVYRLPYKVEFTKTTTVTYLGADVLEHAEIIDSLATDVVYVTDSGSTAPLVSPGMLRWIRKDVKPGDTFTATYKFEATGQASGIVEIKMPTFIRYSLADGQWISTQPTIGKSAILVPTLNRESIELQQGGAGD